MQRNRFLMPAMGALLFVLLVLYGVRHLEKQEMIAHWSALEEEYVSTLVHMEADHDSLTELVYELEAENFALSSALTERQAELDSLNAIEVDYKAVRAYSDSTLYEFLHKRYHRTDD